MGAFAKQAGSVSVNQEGERFTVVASTYDGKASFFPVPERDRVFDAPSDAVLGTAVAEALAFDHVLHGKR